MCGKRLPRLRRASRAAPRSHGRACRTARRRFQHRCCRRQPPSLDSSRRASRRQSRVRATAPARHRRTESPNRRAGSRWREVPVGHVSPLRRGPLQSRRAVVPETRARPPRSRVAVVRFRRSRRERRQRLRSERAATSSRSAQPRRRRTRRRRWRRAPMCAEASGPVPTSCGANPRASSMRAAVPDALSPMARDGPALSR